MWSVEFLNSLNLMYILYSFFLKLSRLRTPQSPYLRRLQGIKVVAVCCKFSTILKSFCAICHTISYYTYRFTSRHPTRWKCSTWNISEELDFTILILYHFKVLKCTARTLILYHFSVLKHGPARTIVKRFNLILIAGRAS